MKILLIHQVFLEEDDPGGSRWNEMTRIWSEQGHQITVLAGMVHYATGKKRPEYKGKYFIYKKQGLVNVWRCHVSEGYNKNFLGRLWGYISFMFSAFWAGLFKAKGKFDIILVTSPPLFVGVSGIMLSKLKRTPYVFEVRDLWPESAIDTGVLTNKWVIRLAYWVESKIYQNAKLINVLTPAFKKVLIEKKQVSLEKIIYIPNAADFSISDELLQTFDTETFRKELGWENKLILVYVGAHGVANHLDQIIDVAAAAQDKPWQFVLIGDGMEKKKLMLLAKENQLNNIQFIDSVSKKEVFKYILASDIGMSVLKKVDTFKTVYSNKTFDYFACKKPVLMAIDGVSRELIEKAGAGIYVEPENTLAYINIISDYYKNKDMIKQHGENGYQFAKENFDRTNLANAYMANLTKVG